MKKNLLGLFLLCCFAAKAQTPSAPGSVVATGINGGGYITFTAPTTVGTGITNYQYSTDNGATWTTPSPAVTGSPLTISGLTNCTTYQMRLRAVNASGPGTASAAVSLTPGSSTEPGITWSTRTTPTDNQWRSVTYGNGLFVAVAVTGTGNQVMTSPDGITWTIRSSPDLTVDYDWQSVTFGNGLFVAVSSNSADITRTVMTSPDGINWTLRTAPKLQWVSVAYGNGLFVAVSVNGTVDQRVMTSPDGITWTSRTATDEINWNSVTYGNGLFVAVANDESNTKNRVMTSPNGITWTSRTHAADNIWRSVAYGNGLFVAVAISGTGNRVMTSPDGTTWTSQSSPLDYNWNGITYGNGLFVAVSTNGSGNRVMTSPNGVDWTLRTSAANNTWFGVTYGNGMFVTVSTNGSNNRVMTSSLSVAPNTPVISSITPSLTSASVAFTSSLPTTLDAPNITNIEYSTNNGSSWTTPSPAVTASPLTISGLTTGTYDVKIRAVNKVGTSCATATSSVTILPNNWIGGNGNWNLAANWSGNAVPAGNTDITISSGTPTLDVDFTLPSGRSLTLSGSGSLIVAAGKRLTVAGTADFGGRPVTFRSDASGTASLGALTGTLNNASNVTVERFIPTAKRAWRLLTIPLTGSNSIRTQWAGVAANANAPTGETAGSGTLITGHNFSSGIHATAAGFDWYSGMPAGSSSSIRYYTHNGSAGSYSSAGNTPDITTTPDKQGYMLFVRGDRTVTTGSGTTTLKPTGTLKTGNQNIPVSAAYEMIGNPYAAAIDLDQVYLNTGNSSTITRNFWIWDATLGTSGGYRAISYGSSDYAITPGTGTATDYLKIQSGQAFFVQRNNAGNILIEENDKTDGSTAPVVLGAGDVKISEGRLFLSLYSASGKLLDGTAIRFGSSYEARPTEVYDMPKINNFNENLSLQREGKYLAIESRPYPSQKDTAFLACWNLSNGIYRMKPESQELLEHLSNAILIDRYSGKELTITEHLDTSGYTFEVNTDSASKSLSRFLIVFSAKPPVSPQLTGLQAIPRQTGIELSWKASQIYGIKHFDIEGSRDGEQFKQIHLHPAGNAAYDSTYTWTDPAPRPGINFYRIRSLVQNGSSSVSNTAKANWNDRSAIQVFPNPSSDGRIKILLQNQQTGNYRLTMRNIGGQQVFQTDLMQSAPNQIHALQIGNGQSMIQTGMYIITIEQENGILNSVRLWINR